ncbi:MAG: aldehyde dehydrogenase family protein, partial [Nitriliruptorales bacterium]|nr:aldehyde dehydrogenase family protein [Nitriliruptorales bacterium]
MADTTIRSLVDGAPWSGEAADTVTITNPADRDDVVATVELGTAATLQAAAAAARRAQPDWAAVPAPVRGVAISKLGRILEENKEALAQIITREIGKPIVESRGEVQEAIDTCIFFASEGRRLYGQTVPSEMPDKQLFTYRTPVGAMCIITAGNFPVAVPSWYIVPALVAGNTVVWKPAEYTPATAEAFTRLIRAAGFPDGAFQLVLTGGQDTFGGLEAAFEDGSLDKVGFTGSVDVGRRIGELCGRHLVTPTLELGGKNPLVVMPDADLDLAVEGSLFSGFGTAGQRCTSLGVAIVHASVKDEFLDRFDKAARE